MEGNEWGAVDLSPMAGQAPEQTQPLVTPGQPQVSAPQGPNVHQAPVAPGMEPPSIPAGFPQGGEATAYVNAPLIVEVTEESFEQQMALSTTVPVVLVLYSSKSLASKQALEVMEDLARQDAGRFQLGKVDVETNPALATAFQAEAIPAGYAILAQRPVPLFEGVPTVGQVAPILEELFQVAPQLGVTGRIQVSVADTEKPMPKEHVPARDAEMRGDWDAAIAAWKKVLASNPSDSEAKQALVRAQFEQRLEGQEQTEESLAQKADALFAVGQEKAAFDLLLEALIASDDADEKESLREQIVGLFQIAADPSAVKGARRRLATYLMV